MSGPTATDDGHETIRPDEPRAAPPGLIAYACPHCGSETGLTNSDQSGPFVTCPGCGGQFVVPAADTAEGARTDSAEPPDTSDVRQADVELDALRIRKVARERRSTIRARSYYLIGAFALLTGAGAMVQKVWQRVCRLHAWDARTWVFVFAAAAACVLAAHLLGYARQIQRELRKPLLDDPVSPPDFSTLSDGSQHWKNLDRM